MNIFCPPYPPSFYQYWSTFPQGQTIAFIIMEPSCVILRNAHGLADKMPPCPPENRGKPGGRRLSIPGDTVSPGMEKAAAAPGAAAFGAGGLRPRPPNKKPGPEALPRPRLFRALCALPPPPLGDRNAIRLAPETWQMRQEKGEVSAKTLPPVMAVSPISPR